MKEMTFFFDEANERENYFNPNPASLKPNKPRSAPKHSARPY
jgi:hypothetical protein